MKGKLWQDWTILVCAVWLFSSPFILDFASASQPAAWVTWILAVFLALSASEAVTFTDEIGEWLDALLGVSLMVAPTAFGYGSDAPAAVSSVMVGLVVTVCAISAMLRDRRLADETFAAEQRHASA